MFSYGLGKKVKLGFLIDFLYLKKSALNFAGHVQQVTPSGGSNTKSTWGVLFFSTSLYGQIVAFCSRLSF